MVPRTLRSTVTLVFTILHGNNRILLDYLQPSTVNWSIPQSLLRVFDVQSLYPWNGLTDAAIDFNVRYVAWSKIYCIIMPIVAIESYCLCIELCTGDRRIFVTLSKDLPTTDFIQFSNIAGKDRRTDIKTINHWVWVEQHPLYWHTSFFHFKFWGYINSNEWICRWRNRGIKLLLV